MARVVTERPRRGSSSRNRKSRLTVLAKKLDEDNDAPGPRKLKMSMNAPSFGYDKEFSDVLGPIERWLHKQARKRRPWSKVYSEIRAVIPNRSSQPIRHIWDAHVMYMVELHCRMGEDGKVYSLGRFRDGWREVDGTCYVHPKTGELRWAPKKKRNRPSPPLDKIQLDSSTALERIRGIWYCRRYEQLAEPDPVTGVGYRILAKQLNKSELKHYGIKNEAAS